MYVFILTKHEEVWQRFEIKYHDEHEKKIEYLRIIWFNEHKERFCKTWINEILHFNNLITSRVEDDHRVLKSIFKFFTKDFMIVVDRFEILLENQYDDYIIKLEQIKMIVIFNLSKKLMSDLIERVSSRVLQKIRKQWKKIKKVEFDEENETLKLCSKSFVTTMKFSCFHMIQICMNTSEIKLLLDDVHFH